MARAAAFEDRARQLFDLRKQHLATFAFDWPLHRVGEDRRYLVRGLYGDEEGATRLCRLHPEIQRFLQAHPAAAHAVTDVTGLRCFRVVR